MIFNFSEVMIYINQYGVEHTSLGCIPPERSHDTADSSDCVDLTQYL